MENNENYIKRSIYNVDREIWLNFASAAKKEDLMQRDFLKELMELYRVYGLFK